MANLDEAELIHQTVTLCEQYRELDKIIDHELAQGGCSVSDISEQIQAIRGTEDTLRPMREQFQRSGESPSEQLKSPTDETIELVKAIMPKLAQLEKNAQEAAMRLVPQIQSGVRAVQMQQAYGATQ